MVRVQVADKTPCAETGAGECALPQFARSRLDPGMVVGVGWEPTEGRIRSIQLATRMSLYGRGEHPEADPRSWLPELDLTIRFSLGR